MGDHTIDMDDDNMDMEYLVTLPGIPHSTPVW